MKALNHRSVGLALLSLLLLGGLGSWLWTSTHRENRFDPIIVQAAKRYRVPPALVKAVIWRESRFRPHVRGHSGEIGLMQVNDLAAHEWAGAEKIFPFDHEHVLDPTTNIYAGSFYLGKLLKRYANTDSPAAYALADYNAGRNHVLRWNQGSARTNALVFQEQIDFPTTRAYVTAILSRYPRYQKEF